MKARVHMKAEDMTSYLMIVSALLLRRSRKCSLAEALAGVPLSNRTKPLAGLLADNQLSQVPAEIEAIVDAATDNWQLVGDAEPVAQAV